MARADIRAGAAPLEAKIRNNAAANALSANLHEMATRHLANIGASINYYAEAINNNKMRKIEQDLAQQRIENAKADMALKEKGLDESIRQFDINKTQQDQNLAIHKQNANTAAMRAAADARAINLKTDFDKSVYDKFKEINAGANASDEVFSQVLGAPQVSSNEVLSTANLVSPSLAENGSVLNGSVNPAGTGTKKLGPADFIKQIQNQQNQFTNY